MADICENIRPAHRPVPGLGLCIRPSQHPWRHRDSFGQTWGEEEESPVYDQEAQKKAYEDIVKASVDSRKWVAEEVLTHGGRIEPTPPQAALDTAIEIIEKQRAAINNLEQRIGYLLCVEHRDRKLPRCAVCWVEATDTRVTTEDIGRRGAIQALIRIHPHVQDLTVLMAQLLADAGPLLKGTRLATEQAQTTSDTVGG